MYNPVPPPSNPSREDVITWAFSELHQLSEEIAKLEERLAALEGGA